MAEYTDDDEDVTAEETRAPLLLEAERVVANNTNAIVACDNNALVKSCDTIPQQFDTVLSLQEYWDSVVVVNDSKSKKWRKGWGAKDRQILSRIKKVVTQINQRIKRGENRETVIAQFDAFYSDNKKSLFKLEKYVKDN